MKTNVLLTVVIAVFVVASSVLGQPPGQDPLNPKILSRLQDALKQDGLDLSYGRAEAWNQTAEWCAYKADTASTDLTLADDEFLVVYGVNHVASGKATYMNLNFYADKQTALFVGSLSDSNFPAATPLYLQGDPAADGMYAYKVSRHCDKDEAYCLGLSPPERCTRLTLDAGTVLTVFDRINLEPATKVGPALPEILYDRVLKISPRPSSSRPGNC